MHQIGTAAIAAVFLAGFMAPGAGLAAPGGRDQLQGLSGVYGSPAPEVWYGGYGTRRFSFEKGRWSLVFTHALDPEMKVETFRFRTEGPYKIGAPSTIVAGAFEATFYEDVKYVTLLTTDRTLAEALGLADCGLRPGVETDISETGCAGWKPVSECREDHDLLALEDEGLRFGVRPRDNDMCTADRRPTALLQPVFRQ